MGAPGELSIPPLVSGGIFLSYRCTSECRHCLYRSSPRRPDEWMAPGTARRVFAALKGEPELESVHISGGEAGLRLDVLEDVIRIAVGTGIGVSYVQTNASWCTDGEETRRRLERLKKAGLESLYVSVSFFHNEFTPFEYSRNCVEAAREVFGPDGVILWSPGGVELYDLLSQMPDDGKHSLEDFLEWARAAGREDAFLRVRDDLIPTGRATEALRDDFEALPAESFRALACLEQLTSAADSGTTFHFHIDYLGNLIMGCCVGLSPATLEDLHPRVTPASHPVFHRLCTEGPFALMEMAADRFGYAERKEGYVSKCDLCFDVRAHLSASGGFPELRPAFIYSGRVRRG